jgi:hypothetical protein
MARIAELSPTIQQIVEAYGRGKTYGAVTYPVVDPTRQIYTVIVVPDYPRKFNSGVAVMARVVGDTVVIDEDITDRPLWEELVRAGVPREKIVLTYAGETLPEQSS